MAAVVTELDTDGSTSNRTTGGGWESADISPTGSRTLLAFFRMQGGQESDPDILNELSMDTAFTKIAEQLEGDASGVDKDGVYVFEGVTAATPGTGSLTFRNQGTSEAKNAGWCIVELPEDASAGSTPGTTDVSAGTTATATITFDDSGSYAIGFCARSGSATGPGTPSTFTLVANAGPHENKTINCSDKANNSSPTWSWTGSSDAIAVAVEIYGVSAAPTAGGNPTLQGPPTEATTPLTWTDSVDNDGCYVQRNGSPGFTPAPGYRISSDLGATTNTYSDTTVNPDGTYYYVIEWTGPTGDGTDSTYSSEVGFKAAPTKPTDLAFSNVSSSSIQVDVTRGATANDDRHRMFVTDSSDDLIETVLLAIGTTSVVIEGLEAGETHTFDIQAYDPDVNSGTGAYSTFYSENQATTSDVTAVSATDGIDLGDSAVAVSGGSIFGVDGVALGDEGAVNVTLDIAVTDGIVLGDIFVEQSIFIDDGISFGDIAVVQIDYPDLPPSVPDDSGWGDKSGLAYPPNVVPQLEPWMERVRVTLEDVIDEVQGSAQILSVNLYIKENGQVYANVRCNEDTVAIKYLFDNTTYPTAAQIDNSGGTHVITSLGSGFQIGPFAPFLSDGDIGYLGIVGYETKTSTDVPSGEYSAPAYAAVTYEMGQGVGDPPTQAPEVYWKTTETAGVGTINLTVVDPQGEPLTVLFWRRTGGGATWDGPDTRATVTSGSTEVHTVTLLSGHNSYIRFEVQNDAGYVTGAMATFDADNTPQILAMNLEIDGSGNVVANWQGGTDTAKVKIADSTSAYPNAATVRAESYQNGQYGTTATLDTLAAGETLYVSGFAYSDNDDESPELSQVSIRRYAVGELGGQGEITFSDSAPGGASTNDLWIETDVDPYVLWRWTGGAWVDVGLLDQGAFAKEDFIDDSNVATRMSVSQLNAISVDVGVLTAGLIKNASSTAGIHLSGTPSLTSFINLNADSTTTHGDNRDFLVKFPGFEIESNGTGFDVTFSGDLSAVGGTFSGTVTSAGTIAAENFTASTMFVEDIRGGGVLSALNATQAGLAVGTTNITTSNWWNIGAVKVSGNDVDLHIGFNGGVAQNPDPSPLDLWVKFDKGGPIINMYKMLRVYADGTNLGIEIDGNECVHIGAGTTTSSRTTSMLFIPTTAGVPTGAPSSSGRAAIVLDEGSDRLYVRTAAGWKYAALT